MNERDKKLLYHLIELRNRDEGVFATVRRLASSGGDLRAAILALEERLNPKPQPEAGPGGGAAAKRPAPLKAEEWEKFCARVGRSPSLRELFSSGLWRSEDPELPRVVATLAEFADLTPDPKHGCRSADEAFMAALDDARKKNVPDAAGLLNEVVADLIGLISDHRDVASMLDRLAEPPHWRDVLKRLETGQGAGDELPGEAGKNFNELLRVLRGLPPEVRASLFRGRRMSQRVSPALFRLAWRSQKEFDAALHSLTEADMALDLTRRRQRQAEEALRLLRTKPGEKALLDRTEAEMRLRFEAAQHLLGVRERVKRDALIHGWPEAGLLAMSNFEALKEVERLILKNRGALQPPADAFQHEESQALYDLCKAEPGLTRFLRLIPHFSEMDIRHLAQGGAAEALMLEAEIAVESRPAATTPTTTTGTEAKQETGTPPVSDTSAEARVEPQPPQPPLSATIHLLRPVGESVTPGIEYEGGFALAGEQRALVKIRAPSLPKSLLTNDILPALGVPSGGETNRYLTDMFDRPDASERITRAGVTLYDWLYALLYKLDDRRVMESLDQFIRDAGQGGRDVRLFVNTNDESVAALPWEWLVLGSHDRIFSATPRCHLLRSSIGKRPEPVGELYPLRILVVASESNEQAVARVIRKLNRLNIIEDTSGKVEAYILLATNADIFAERYNDYVPHVVYFEAQVVRRHTASGGISSFISLGTSETDWMQTAQVIDLLRDSATRLVVFGDNPTGGFENNPLLGFVFDLMKAGLHAALVPTRPTQDGPSVTFLNNFFSGWISGLPLETAVSNARDVLREGDGDWSAYALFAREEVLPQLRVPAPPPA